MYEYKGFQKFVMKPVITIMFPICEELKNIPNFPNVVGNSKSCGIYWFGSNISLFVQKAFVFLNYWLKLENASNLM